MKESVSEVCERAFLSFEHFYKLYKKNQITYPENYSDKDKDDFNYYMENCLVDFSSFLEYLNDHIDLIDNVLSDSIIAKMEILELHHIRKLNYAGKPFMVYGDKWAPANISGWLSEYKLFIKNYLDQQKSAKLLIDSEVHALRGRIENYTAAQIFEGNLEAYDIYVSSAESNSYKALIYEVLFLIVLCSIGCFSYSTFEKFQNTINSLETSTIVIFLISKFFVACVVIAICTYLIKRSSQHRKMAQIEKTTALELKAMGPYLKGISDDKIEEIKISLVSSYFGVSHIKDEDFHVNEALTNNLKATSEILKATSEAAKAVSETFKK